MEENNPASQINQTENNRNVKLLSNINKYPNMTRSQTLDYIFPKETNWSEDIKNYYNQKKKLQWGYNPKPNIISLKSVKSAESIFNPITQKFTNTNFETELKKSEQKNLIDKIANFYDKELRNIQTYNIINLRDRFKGFEHHPNYPDNNKEIQKKPNIKYKPINLKKEKNYNIISNLNFNIHHYDKPENRPIEKNGDNFNNNSMNNLRYNNCFKDYNIINNRYYKFNNDKTKTDLDLIKLNAATKFYKSRDYDIIKGVFCNPEKEERYQENKKIENEKLKNKKRDCVFNPFTNEIYDQEKFEELKKKFQNSIYRYSLKPQIDNYYHRQQLRKDIIKEKELNSKLIYNRYKDIDKRGYDFINHDFKYNVYKNSLNFKNIKNPWEILQGGVNENENLSKKELFLSYDKEDSDKKYNKCKVDRVKIVKNLPKIEKDELFCRKSDSNIIERRQKNKIYFGKRNEHNSFEIDKNLWFSQDKNSQFN